LARLVCSRDGLIRFSKGIEAVNHEWYAEIPRIKEVIDKINRLLRENSMGDVVFCVNEGIHSGSAVMSYYAKVFFINMIKRAYIVSYDNFYAIAMHETGHLYHRHMIKFLYRTAAMISALWGLLLLLVMVFRRNSKPVNILSSVLWLLSLGIELIVCVSLMFIQKGEYEADEYSLKAGFGKELVTLFENANYSPIELNYNYFLHSGHKIVITHPSDILRTDRLREIMKS